MAHWAMLARAELANGQICWGAYFDNQLLKFLNFGLYLIYVIQG
jgi:hypothetical protein